MSKSPCHRDGKDLSVNSNTCACLKECCNTQGPGSYCICPDETTANCFCDHKEEPKMSEPNFTVGDTVAATSGVKYAVLSVDGEFFWGKREGAPYPNTLHVEGFSKVKPFFEVGKTYKYIGGSTLLFKPKYIEENTDGEKVAVGLTGPFREDQWEWNCKSAYNQWREV